MSDNSEIARIRGKVLRLEDKTGILTVNNNTSSFSGDVNITGNISFAPSAEKKITFNSLVNAGSDKAFIYYKEESAYHVAGSYQENSRLSIGVYNDNEINVGEGLDLQGAASLIFNVGTWDSELNAAIGEQYAPAGSPFGNPIKFRINNVDKMMLEATSGNLGLGTNPSIYKMTIGGYDALYPACFKIEESTHATSRRATISLGNNWEIGQDSSGNGIRNLYFYQAGVGIPLFIDTANNIGIGTTTPARKLEINNTMKFTNSSANADDGVIGTATFGQPGLNFVGINTDGGGRKLSIWSSIKQLENTSGNSFIGSTTIQQDSWIAPTLLNSFYNFDVINYQSAGFYKDSNGRVWLRGLVGRASAALSTSIFTLPSGYRPSKWLLFSVVANNNFARLDVDTNGNVFVPAANSPTWYNFISLDGISFDTR